MKAPLLRTGSVLALACLAGCKRSTVIYAPQAVEGPIRVAGCDTDWNADAGRITLGDLRAQVEAQKLAGVCDLRLLAHRAGSRIDWRENDPGVAEGEIVQRVLVEIGRGTLRPFRLHALVGDLGRDRGALPSATTLIEGLPGRDGADGEPAIQIHIYRERFVTTEQCAQPPCNGGRTGTGGDDDGDDDDGDDEGGSTPVAPVPPAPAPDVRRVPSPDDESVIPPPCKGESCKPNSDGGSPAVPAAAAAAGAGLGYALALRHVTPPLRPPQPPPGAPGGDGARARAVNEPEEPDEGDEPNDFAGDGEPGLSDRRIRISRAEFGDG